MKIFLTSMGIRSVHPIHHVTN